MTTPAVESAPLMVSTTLQGIADAVVRRARLQGFVVPRDVRAELTHAGESPDLWKDVLALARPGLRYRGGRYWFDVPVSDRVRQQQSQQEHVTRATRQLIRRHREVADSVERRGEDRIDFIQPVKVQAEDGREFTLLSRDLSTSGIRLIGTRSLLGQRVRVTIPAADGAGPWCFVVRILWTAAVGDDLFENGGTFLEIGA